MDRTLSCSFTRTNDNFLFQTSKKSMDARQLKAFVAVFEERNITRAAERLCLTQPTLSVTIRQLEEELGCSLFTREARGVLVSDAASPVSAGAALAGANDATESAVSGSAGLPAADAGRGSRHRQRTSCCLAAPLHTAIAAITAGNSARLHRQICVWPAKNCAVKMNCFFRCGRKFCVGSAGGCRVRTMHLADETDALQAAQLDWIICPQHPSHQRLLAWLGGGGDAIATAHQAGSLQLARYGTGRTRCRLTAPESADRRLRSQRLSGAAPSRRIGLCYAANACRTGTCHAAGKPARTAFVMHRTRQAKRWLCKYRHLSFPDSQTFCRRQPDRCAQHRIWPFSGFKMV
jgi:hypothetical protein